MFSTGVGATKLVLTVEVVVVTVQAVLGPATQTNRAASTKLVLCKLFQIAQHSATRKGNDAGIPRTCP